MKSICGVLLGVLAVSCGGPPSFDDTVTSPTAHTENGYAELGQSRLYYEISGDGSPVVLIHGGLLDLRMWDPQMEAFTARYRVLRYDASSHGRSVTPPDAYFDHEDLDRLLTHLDIDRAVLVGLSMGGRIAIDLALEHPDRVEALVVVGPGLGGFRFDSPEVQAARPEAIEAWGAGDWDRVTEIFQRQWTDGPHRAPEDVDPEVRETVRTMIRATLERAADGQVTEGRTMDPPAIDRLDELDVPTLVIVGELDMPDIHEIADLLVAKNPNAERIEIDGVAHMVNLESPDEFNRTVLEFLTRVHGS
jgi:pimeloyl-ACP methyl ester carboxylesterase